MTQPDQRLWANVCRQCGQSQNDDHAVHGIQAPMLHYGLDSYHLDCIPFDIEQMHRPQHSEAIDAAKAGKRGQELHVVIQTAATAFRESEAAWLLDEANAFAKTGVANTDPTHPMFSKAGA